MIVDVDSVRVSGLTRIRRVVNGGRIVSLGKYKLEDVRRNERSSVVSKVVELGISGKISVVGLDQVIGVIKVTRLAVRFRCIYRLQ